MDRSAIERVLTERKRERRSDVASDRARRKGGEERRVKGSRVSMLTGGQDRHYWYGLTMALIGRGVRLDFVGSDELDGPELHNTPMVRFLNLRGNQKRSAPID